MLVFCAAVAADEADRVREDRRFVVGKGNFAADIVPQGVKHVALVTCPHPAARIISIETVAERIALAKASGATDVIDFMKEDVYDRIMELTKGRGADACIDAVGTEAEPKASADSMLDRIKH